jgi:hypothetical protein
MQSCKPSTRRNRSEVLSERQVYLWESYCDSLSFNERPIVGTHSAAEKPYAENGASTKADFGANETERARLKRHCEST